MADRPEGTPDDRRTVWILNHYATPPGSGVGTRHFDLGQQLASRDWRVVVFAAGFNHFTGREERLKGRQLHRVEQHAGVTIVWLRTIPYRGNGVRRIANMLSYFAAALTLGIRVGRRRPPASIIGSTVHPFAALAGWVLARAFKARFYFEIRDLWPQSLVDIGALGTRNPGVVGLRWIEAFLVARATAVITLLQGIQGYFDEHNETPRSVVYIPNGVNLAPPASDETLPDAAGELLDRWADRFVVAYTGAHGLTNDLDRVLEAAAHLQQRDEAVGLVFVGDGPTKPNLIERSQQLGLRNVAFLPPMPNGALRLFLSRVDACLVHVVATPVHRFGVSFNKVFDYMASSKPIIFVCETPFDPVATSRSGISVRPGDPARLAGAIVELAATAPEDRDAMGRRGRGYVERHHDVRELGGRLDALLRSGADE